MPDPGVVLTYVLIGVVAFICLGLTAVVATRRPSYPGWRTWALSLLTFVAGVTVGLIRSPATLLASVLLGNALLGLSGVFALSAFRRFGQVRPRLELGVLAALPALLLGLAYFTLVRPDLGTRVLLVGAYSFSTALLIAGMCVRRALGSPSPERRPGYLLGAATFLTIILLGLPRSVVALSSPSQALTLLTLTPLLTGVYLTSFLVFVLGGTFSLLVLHDDRRRQEVAPLEAHLSHLSVTDPLTGLLNRRGLDARCTPGASPGWPAPLSLAVVDLDHFKRVNDQHGHAVGDQCLRVLAGVLRDEARREDVVARYGGEEFVLVLPGLGATDARGLLESAQTTLMEQARAAGLPPLSFSAGVVERQEGETLDGMFVRADTLLLAARAAGRRRVLGGTSHAGARRHSL